MPVAARSWMATGVAALSATAIVAAPAVRPLPDEAATREVRLAASQVVSPEFREIVAAAAQQLAAPQNAATNVVDSVYSAITYWTDYGVELADYALQFVPFGYLISSQINIIYPQIIGVTDSIVYDLIDPVLENPVDLAAYIDGLVDVAVSTVTALVNVAVGEVDYFFGWLIPPLPGPFPFPTLSVAEDEVVEEKVVEDEVVEDEVALEEVANVELEAPLEEPAEEPAEEVAGSADGQDLGGELSDGELSDGELSDGADVAPPEQPGSGTDADGGEEQDAVGHDVTPAEDDVASRPTEGERDEGEQPSPEG
ncbi:hypothetical protein H7K36_26030 [Mycolicibacterium litorale]|uniref:PE-PGRS family protein n=1 Tax=Mycolicibacterium litorale TaxID=758802 RepID=A0AAD1IGV4_9MYCO|nr:hypothetical protein [Mycolicibacterium litorale]TDY05831.1 hypothetical protein BCL50_2139 [Mycolicibacterium litorale]BBY14661.1 hypothetical protein MLIT_02530 [Mycolicibacterium litorale]